MEIRYIDRLTKQTETEKVYGKFFLEILYGKNPLAWLLSFTLLPLICKIPFFSKLYGSLQKSPLSKKKVRRFIEDFHIDTTEFLDPVDSYQSFNDFFIRKLKPSARPINDGNDQACLIGDARYLVYPDIHSCDGFLVKGKKFSLEQLLKSGTLAHKYQYGGMVIARLCPVDYHRFHFPCNCIPNTPRLINGPLYSVNPIALRKNIDILAENKRVITELHTKQFGTILYIEVGATYVGSIHQTFNPNEHHAKGDEKGFFEFGGSCVILLFPPFRIQFDQDLIDASRQGIEVKGLLGQSLGRALPPL